MEIYGGIGLNVMYSEPNDLQTFPKEFGMKGCLIWKLLVTIEPNAMLLKTKQFAATWHY